MPVGSDTASVSTNFSLLPSWVQVVVCWRAPRICMQVPEKKESQGCTSSQVRSAGSIRSWINAIYAMAMVGHVYWGGYRVLGTAFGSESGSSSLALFHFVGVTLVVSVAVVLLLVDRISRSDSELARGETLRDLHRVERVGLILISFFLVSSWFLWRAGAEGGQWIGFFLGTVGLMAFPVTVLLKIALSGIGMVLTLLFLAYRTIESMRRECAGLSVMDGALILLLASVVGVSSTDIPRDLALRWSQGELEELCTKPSDRYVGIPRSYTPMEETVGLFAIDGWARDGRGGDFFSVDTYQGWYPQNPSGFAKSPTPGHSPYDHHRECGGELLELEHIVDDWYHFHFRSE